MTDSTMTIEEACAAIDYNPAAGFADKTDAQQWSMVKSKRIERAVRDAKNLLATNLVGTDLFGTLPEDIQAAITTIAVKRTGGGGSGGARKNVFMDNVRSFLTDIGDAVDELEMFKATKMGRGEIRAKIRENLKSCDAANRMWVELDDEAEEWVLIGLGEDKPEGWLGADIE